TANEEASSEPMVLEEETEEEKEEQKQEAEAAAATTSGAELTPDNDVVVMRAILSQDLEPPARMPLSPKGPKQQQQRGTEADSAAAEAGVKRAFEAKRRLVEGVFSGGVKRPAYREEGDDGSEAAKRLLEES